MNQSLSDLLTLQDLDLAGDQLRHRRAHLTELADVTRLAAELEDATGEETTTRATLDDLAARQAAAEEELASTEGRAATISRRLYGGEVSASKDLQAMSTELDLLKTRSSSLEEDVLAIMEEREPVEARLRQIEGRQATLRSELEEARRRLTTAQAELDAELAELDGRRAQAAEPVPAALKTTYDRLRARLGGVAVARLVGNHCDGCHLTLSSAELEHVRHLPEGEIYTCEQCSRILVPQTS